MSVLLVDPDNVEPRNLALSSLLRRAVTHGRAGPACAVTLSQNKAELLAAAARALDRLPWHSASCEIADVGWQELQESDLFCCCSDTILSRVETAWIARSLGKPMLDGAVFGQSIAGGRVTVYPAASSAACPLCGLSEDRRAAVLGYAASVSMGCQEPEDTPAMTAALATLDAVADTMLARIRCWQQLASNESWSTRLSQDSGGAWQAEPIHLTRSATCPWHDEFRGTVEALPWEMPVDRVLQRATRELVLSWPLCTEAMCDACGARSRPMQRVARVRRSPCPVCGRSTQQPLRAIHRIRHGDPYSTFSPRQLGMPERHLYWLRDTAPEVPEHKVVL